MFWTNCLKGALLATCAAVVLTAPVAIAQDRDSQEVSSDVLTDAGLAKYMRAAKNISALPTRLRKMMNATPPRTRKRTTNDLGIVLNPTLRRIL